MLRIAGAIGFVYTCRQRLNKIKRLLEANFKLHRLLGESLLKSAEIWFTTEPGNVLERGLQHICKLTGLLRWDVNRTGFESFFSTIHDLYPVKSEMSQQRPNWTQRVRVKMGHASLAYETRRCAGSASK